jgi:hypothetical protein
MNKEMFEVFKCLFTVTDYSINTILMNEWLEAPRFVLEQQYVGLLQQAIQHRERQLEVKISRYQYVEGRSEPLLLDITFRNWQ